jgi:ATP-dependent protease ClpP protease subunit
LEAARRARLAAPPRMRDSNAEAMTDNPRPCGPSEITGRLLAPDLFIRGQVTEAAYEAFRSALPPLLEGEGPLVVEISSPGGDADVGRRFAEDLRLLRERHDRDVWVLGKTMVYSAGVSILAAAARERRWLTRDTTLLIHERRIAKTVELDGPLSEAQAQVDEVRAEIEAGLRLQDEGFAELAAGSSLSLEALRDRARANWYVPAEEALSLGLVGGIL